MRKTLFLFFMSFALFAQAAHITRGPYVEDPTQTTAVFHMQTDVSTPAWLEYGPAPRCNQIMTISPKGTEHKFVLHGLVANKEFCYKMYVMNNTDTGVQNPVEGKFNTLYSADRKIVKFVIFGNTAGSVTQAQLVDKLAQYEPDFYIHTGDITASGLNADANAEFFNPFQPLFLKAPMFIAVGETAYGEQRAEKDSRNFLRNNYSRYHNMSWSRGTPNYYYFDTANARFIFVDTSAADGAVNAPSLAKDSAQAAWLKTALATTESGKWKIVTMHHPAYSSGAKGSNFDVRETFSTIFENYGVNIVFQGHDYNYERTFRVRKGEENPRGVTYMTFGTGASPVLTKREFKEDWTARFLSAQIYGVGEIVDRKLTIKIYSLDDRLIETVEIYL